VSLLLVFLHGCSFVESAVERSIRFAPHLTRILKEGRLPLDPVWGFLLLATQITID